jgi:hypothetical protein
VVIAPCRSPEFKVGESYPLKIPISQFISRNGKAALVRFNALDDQIGVLEISIRKTVRRRLKTVIVDSVSCAVGVSTIPIWIKQEARKNIDKFSEAYPRDEEVALHVCRVFGSVLRGYF